MLLKNNMFDLWNLTALNIKKMWTKRAILLLIAGIWLVINIGLVTWFRIQSNTVDNIAKNNKLTLFTISIFFNNWYLLFITTYLQIFLFTSSSSKGLISLEKRYGYKTWHIIFSRLICILLIIVVLNLLMAVIGGLTLINSSNFQSWIFNRNVKTYFVLIFTTFISTLFVALIFSFCKVVVATIVIVFVNTILVFFATTNISIFWSSKDKTISSATLQIERGVEFFQATKNSGLDEIYDVKDFLNEALGESLAPYYLQLKMIGSVSEISERRFWQMGQVLNIDPEKNISSGDEQYILYQVNPQLFSFFKEFEQALLGYQSNIKITDSLFSETQNSKVVIPDLQPLIKHLQTNLEFWNKYKDIFTVITKDLQLQYKFGKWWKINNQSQVGLTTLLDDSIILKQRESNEFYERVPEFCILAQSFMSYWVDVIDNSLIAYNQSTVDKNQYFVDFDYIKKYNKTFFVKSVFEFPKWWILLNTNNSWTNSNENNKLNYNVYKNNVIDLSSFDNIFDKTYYQEDNYYKKPYLENVNVKTINSRTKILGVVYAVICILGIVMYVIIHWRFKYFYKL